MPKERSAKLAAGMSTAAAIGSLLAWINSRQAGAAPPPEEVVLPEEFVRVIAAIAASADSIDANTLQIIDELARLVINVKGWPSNVKRIRSFGILCLAANTAYQANDMEIPDGMSLIIKSHPLNAVGSLVWVATSRAEATNPNSSYPLIPNEGVSYAVQNAKEFYVSSNIAGSIAIFSAEKKE